MHAATDEPVYFDAVLRPHRSLSPKGFAILMVAFATLSVGIGLWFVTRGAWPVLGYFGLDVLLLWLAFRRSFRDGSLFERVRLTRRELSVRREGPREPPREWRFQPFWLRVAIDDPPEHHSQLTLSSHGRSVVVGSFLTPEERLDFARALRAALRRSQTDRAD